jgi:hypothetical protein
MAAKVEEAYSERTEKVNAAGERFTSGAFDAL